MQCHCVFCLYKCNFQSWLNKKKSLCFLKVLIFTCFIMTAIVFICVCSDNRIHCSFGKWGSSDIAAWLQSNDEWALVWNKNVLAKFVCWLLLLPPVIAGEEINLTFTALRSFVFILVTAFPVFSTEYFLPLLKFIRTLRTSSQAKVFMSFEV